MGKIVSIILSFSFAWAAWTAIRLGVSETIFREDTAATVTRAIAVQDSAAFEERLAELDPGCAGEALGRAVGMNSRASSVWVALGLFEEAAGEFAAAERSLMQAAGVDHQFPPAWTLTNFYFRRSNIALFWKWADRAAALTYDDYRPLLRLADQLEPDPVRLLSHFGDLRRLRPPYLNFLIGENRLDEAQQVARAMSGDRANDPHLVDLADRQLRAGNADAAVEIWNLSSGFSLIDPSAGRILTNGDLGRAPLNLGFDWRLEQPEGVAENWKASELIFTFSGSQKESCALLEQTLVLLPRSFRLRFDYMTGAVAPTGVHWSLDNREGPAIEPSSAWKEGTFELPRTRGLARLKLVYRREPGTVRTEGRIEIRNLRLEASWDGPW
jgi:tetratricopeptide (TPR) repeat protein